MECERITGTRTQVQFTRSSGRCRILRPSFCIFISSVVKPFSSREPICGMQLYAIWHGNCEGTAFFPAQSAETSPSSASSPPCPAPLTA